VKEVLPLGQSSVEKQFFHEDLRLYRHETHLRFHSDSSRQESVGDNSDVEETIRDQILREWAQLIGLDAKVSNYYAYARLIQSN
jgi:hypothetical protein